MLFLLKTLYYFSKYIHKKINITLFLSLFISIKSQNTEFPKITKIDSVSIKKNNEKITLSLLKKNQKENP